MAQLFTDQVRKQVAPYFKLRPLGEIFGPEKPSRTILQIRFLSIVVHTDARIPFMMPVKATSLNRSCM